MFEIMVAWYFLSIGTYGNTTIVGPFSHESKCSEIRQWTARHNRDVSECWYGPAITLAKPSK